MKHVEFWWRKEGSLELNRALIELAGEHLGYIPLMNILSGFERLTNDEKEDLVPLMVKDGCKIRKQVFEDDSILYSIWVK